MDPPSLSEPDHAVSGARVAAAPEPEVVQITFLAPGQRPSSFLGLVLITVLRAARAPLLGASMLVARAGSVGADPGAVSRVGVAPNGFCPF